MALLSPLSDEERATFLVVSLPRKDLLKLVGRLGTAPKGTRVDGMSVWDLAWSLVDYYQEDVEVGDAVDKALARRLGEPALAAAVSAEGGADALAELVLRSPDPARDLAWAMLRAGGGSAGERAAELVRTIIADYDQAEESAREQERAAEPAGDEESAVERERERWRRERQEVEREAARARAERERAQKRAEALRERVVELEQAVASARKELRESESRRRDVESERDRLAEERAELRAELRSGTAAEVARLRDELEAARRHERVLEEEVDEMRGRADELVARLRSLEEQASERPAAPAEEATPGRIEGAGGWSLPVFTDEFYESIRPWDRKVVRIAFEKVYRLAEDWRHPSLRAIPLEGIPGYFRIRIASDVRLIYRPADGGRVEILSLIDREDLTRYIRQAKTR